MWRPFAYKYWNNNKNKINELATKHAQIQRISNLNTTSDHRFVESSPRIYPQTCIAASTLGKVSTEVDTDIPFEVKY